MQMLLDIDIHIYKGRWTCQVHHHHIGVVELFHHARLVGGKELSLLERPYFRRMNGRKIVMRARAIRKEQQVMAG